MARPGFSLVELLAVVAIIAIALGAVLSSGVLRRDERRAQVEAAAAELAGTLRQARAFAMERNLVAAVSFNIANAPGSSGWTLNNRAGGHWYGILGQAVGRSASQLNYDGHFPFPRSRYYTSTGSYAAGTAVDTPFRHFTEAVDSAWYGERHVLPAGKVRFLAIGDQDNGDRAYAGRVYQPAGEDHFYPRPWFGRWDETERRLHAWGGYEPALKDFTSTPTFPTATGPRTWLDGTVASYTGFFYEGKDGPIPGCCDPADRGLLDDTDGDGRYRQSGAAADDPARRWPLYRQGRNRPLIDAGWLDLFLIFNPDGTVAWGPPFAGRREWGEGMSSEGYGFGATVFNDLDGNLHLIGPGERLGHGGGNQSPTMAEIGNHLQHTGAWYITLAPDLPDDPEADQGRHPSAQAALESLLPMFRVYVTPGGETGYVEVRRTLPAGAAWEPVGAAQWRDAAFLKAEYPDGSLRDAEGRPRGRPIVDVLLPEMLREARWWLR